jgi:hypothetical protein
VVRGEAGKGGTQGSGAVVISWAVAALESSARIVAVASGPPTTLHLIQSSPCIIPIADGVQPNASLTHQSIGQIGATDRLAAFRVVLTVRRVAASYEGEDLSIHPKRIELSGDTQRIIGVAQRGRRERPVMLDVSVLGSRTVFDS